MTLDQRITPFETCVLNIDPKSMQWRISRGALTDCMRINLTENYNVFIDGVFYRAQDGLLHKSLSNTQDVMDRLRQVIHNPAGEYERIRSEEGHKHIHPLGMATVYVEYNGEATYKKPTGEDILMNIMVLRSGWVFAQRLLSAIEEEQDSYHLMRSSYVDSEIREELLDATPLSYTQVATTIENMIAEQLNTLSVQLFDLML